MGQRMAALDKEVCVHMLDRILEFARGYLLSFVLVFLLLLLLIGAYHFVAEGG